MPQSLSLGSRCPILIGTQNKMKQEPGIRKAQMYGKMRGGQNRQWANRKTEMGLEQLR